MPFTESCFFDGIELVVTTLSGKYEPQENSTRLDTYGNNQPITGNIRYYRVRF
jgi:hypothetical protein